MDHTASWTTSNTWLSMPTDYDMDLLVHSLDLSSRSTNAQYPPLDYHDVTGLGWSLNTAAGDADVLGGTQSSRSNQQQVPRIIAADAYDPVEYLNYVSNLDALHMPSSPSTNYIWDSSADAITSPITGALMRDSLLTDPISSSSSAAFMSRDCSIASFGSSTNTVPNAIDMMRLHSNLSSSGASFCSFESEIPHGISSRFSFSSPSQPLSRVVSLAADSVDESTPPSASAMSHRRRRHHHSSSASLSQSAFLPRKPSPSPQITLNGSIMKGSSSSRSSKGRRGDSDSPSQGMTNRPTRRRHEQVQQARNCPIAPKKNHSLEPIPTAPHMVRIRSADGTSKEVGVLPRNKNSQSGQSAAYVRPQHPKLRCPYCTDHPEGFRGEHELQRHASRAHAPVRRVWICVDDSNDGFLASCKSCSQGKKYGAYYNAAAHLRRTHFNPRKRGRKAKSDGEKRGGKAGGDWPPMDVLKARWMREVEEIVDPLTGNTTATATTLVTAAASFSSQVLSSTSSASTTNDDDDNNDNETTVTPSHSRHAGAARHSAAARVHVPFGDPALTTYGSWHGDDDPALSLAVVGLLADEHALFPQQLGGVDMDEEWMLARE